MRNIREIIVHCTATRFNREVTVAEIDSWHKSFGWKGIGYHYVVMLDGKICIGRAVEEVGAHCRGHNSFSIGVVYVGGIDGMGQPADTRTPAQKIALRDLLMSLKKKHPQAHIFGHRDFAAKACPCFNASAEYADI